MLNLADLGMLLATVTGALAGLGAARQHGVGWPVVFFILLGLVVGAAIGIVGNKLSYAALARSSAPTGQHDTVRNYAFTFLYLLVPLLSMAIATGLTILLTVGILSVIQ
jgi:hypothetical protein